MNDSCSNTVLIRSLNAVFFTKNFRTSFHFAMTKLVVVNSVGRKMLWKFYNVIFIGPLCSWCSCLLPLLWSLSTIRKNLTTKWNAVKLNLSCRNLRCLGHWLHGSLSYVLWTPIYPYGSWLHLKWIEAIECRANHHKVVVNFLKENIFSHFEFPRAIISDGGKHFYNRTFEVLMKKYCINHRVPPLVTHKLVAK